MKVCLISPPTVNEFTERIVAESEARQLTAQHAPMGILSLAAVLEQAGIDVELVDLNQLFYQYIAAGDREKGRDFCAFACAALQTVSTDIFGFSTICSTYPLTIRLARALRETHPGTRIILGGPQASVVDVATLRTFPFVDVVVRGEAEVTLPLLLDSISRESDPGLLSGITYRKGDEIVRNPNAPVIEDLDALPMPAFHLYSYLSDCVYAPIEAGRGCPFACSFCSTNDFFRRRFRMKSPQVLVEQMKSIKRQYGIVTFDLIHDMFTVDRKKVLSFCDAVENSGEELYWSCSARTDCIDDQMMARMAETGCNGIFFGIDSGSDRMQEIMQKGLNLHEAAARIKSSCRHQIKSTVSLIAGFPEETRDDLRSTIHFIGESLRFADATIQLHLLAPLAETPITTKYFERLVYDDIFSDISFEAWEQHPEERALILEHREIFPNFYAVPTQWIDREYLRELREFILHGVIEHRWLMLLLHRAGGELLRVFDTWLDWIRHGRDIPNRIDGSRTYYASENFSVDLLRFVQSPELASICGYPHLLRAMADVEKAQLSLKERETPRRRSKPGEIIESMESVPVLAGDAQMLLISADYKKLMRCLKRKERLDQIPEVRMAVVIVQGKDQVRVIQLTPSAYELMQLCNGSRTITEITDEFSASDLPDISPIKASIYGLASLAQEGLINIRAAIN